jgi:hypothetical protein
MIAAMMSAWMTTRIASPIPPSDLVPDVVLISSGFLEEAGTAPAEAPAPRFRRLLHLAQSTARPQSTKRLIFL